LGLKEIYGASYTKHAESQLRIIEQITEHLETLKSKTDAMVEERKKANKMTDTHKKAYAYCEQVKPYFEEIRYHSDKLERLVDDQLWPLTKYRELLFVK
jgi:glutamine synthetase